MSDTLIHRASVVGEEAPPVTEDETKKDENPFVKGSVYRITSLGTQDSPTVSEGEFLGFTGVGMSGEGMTVKLGKAHGDDAGRKRVIPMHMLLHVDVLDEASEDEDEEEETHHYYS